MHKRLNPIMLSLKALQPRVYFASQVFLLDAMMCIVISYVPSSQEFK